MRLRKYAQPVTSVLCIPVSLRMAKSYGYVICAVKRRR